MSDRDREAATAWLDDMRGDATLVEPSPEALADLLAEREAAARARAVEEATGAQVQALYQRIEAASLAFGEESDAVRCLMDALMRVRSSLPDPELVVVRREDLRHVLEKACVGHDANAESFADCPHCAALARLGESDG